MPRLPTPFRSQPKPKESDWQSRKAEWRDEYGSTRWRKLRWWIGLNANWMCVRCQRPAPHEGTRDSPAGECDHMTPAHDVESFYEESNLQWLCKSCHSKKTTTEDGGRRHA